MWFLIMSHLVGAEILPFVTNMPPPPVSMMYSLPYPSVPFHYMPLALQTSTMGERKDFVSSLLESVASIVNSTSNRPLSDYVPPQVPVSIPETETSYRGEWETQVPKIVYVQAPPQREQASGLANLVNSLPAPDIMFRIGDLWNLPVVKPKKKTWRMPQKTVMSEQTEFHSFPITKDDDYNEKKYDDSTLLGLLQSGRWKTIDWRRKLLGIDEIPSAEEGNALAQILDRKRY